MPDLVVHRHPRPRSRYRRDTANPPGFILQPRDIELLSFLSQVRFALRDQLARVIFPGSSDYACKNRLKLLWQHGLVDRLFYPPFMLALPTSQAGHGVANGPAVYSLTRKGAETVAHATNLPARDVPHETKAHELSPSFVLHELTLTDIRVAFMTSGALATWESTKQAADRYLLQGKQRQHAPDAYGRLELDGQAAHVFIEVDRGTESVRQRIRKKLDGYRNYFGSTEYAGRYGGRSLGTATRVLFVTTQTDKRVESIKTEAERYPAARQYWFTTRHRLNSAHPFVDNVWQRGSTQGWLPFWVPADQYFLNRRSH